MSAPAEEYVAEIQRQERSLGTAGAHCIYLERDIKNRLNRYNAGEDITDVWIWAVDLGNGIYDLYIGYA